MGGLSARVAAEPELLESRPETPRARRRRWPWWTLAAVVVVAAAWPSVSAWLTRASARHVVATWSEELAWRTGREALADDLLARLVVGEERLFTDTLVAVDREQAQRLRALAASIRRDAWHTVGDDVQATADRVRRALVLEARALDAQADRLSGSTDTALPDLPDTTMTAVFDAGSDVARLAETRELAPPGGRHVRPAAVDAVVGRLSAPVVAGVPLRLVVTAADAGRVVDLRTGAVTTLDGRTGLTTLPLAVLAPTRSSPGEVGTGVDGRVVLQRLGGPRSTRDLGDGLLLPRAGGGGWVIRGLEVYTVAAGAEPVRVGTLPADAYVAPRGQPRDRLVLMGEGGVSLWDPATGQETAFGQGGCPPHPIGSGLTTVVWVGCEIGGEWVSFVEVTDARTGASRRVRLTPPLPPLAESSLFPTGQTLSPDGTSLAVVTEARPGTPASYALPATQATYVDLRTGRTRLVAAGGEPLGWSPDGTRLAVAVHALREPIVGYEQALVVRLWSPDGAVTPAARLMVRGTLVAGALLP